MNTNVKTVEIYERITNIIWRRLAPTFGERTIAAIARNVVALDSAKYPILQHLQVTDQGSRWGTLKYAVQGEGSEDVTAGLDTALDDLFEALSDLIGRLIVSKVMTEAKGEAQKEGGQ